MSSIVLASGNAGKIREIQAILQNDQILPQSQFNVVEPEETGATFIENAIIKARNAALHCNLPAIADDSGLAVDALGGAPGVISARYAGVGASDQANLDKLLEEMRDVPDPERSARFICVMVYLRHALDPTPIIAQGVWEGRILRQAVGENGFGYDPVFWVEQYQCSSAQLAPELKNALSHRGQALQALSQQLAGL
ncbi:RdgB/HAM1 family non-canonical purine NTP pyrophosphatase [Methylomonas sp. LW13]|uniref:RdgB/HAM1 family non-canonical purine NTP pyrophosphatase n=1 Tax=unclassified Methylomonas TaxID=2608980 RepID=UPI00051BFC1A|nr:MULTISPECIES: RdgB/HAM1 family non-canonical purine NTP pyrophosphatase [unclassified Methylomonas]PKD39189.1 non-canonical purine NTP pyrophosphatase, RdgB/HAM1 family [Methylomonas sp. Kb3]QBC25492.1 RdgB/HAM1 family non-canonical purine NTP pyrophosphatase [Methylomonas sp. LW13]